MNSRFRIWLKSIGLTVDDYEAARKKADGNPTVLVINGLSEFVVPAYIRWSDAQWTEWANQLGFQPTRRASITVRGVGTLPPLLCEAGRHPRVRK